MTKSLKKLYYSIGEVSKITGLKPHVLRYWESEFPMLSPMKNRAGNRVYREKELKLIQYIKYLLYEKKYTIDGAKKFLKEMKSKNMEMVDGEMTVGKVKNGVNENVIFVLRKVKKELVEILKVLERYNI
ncbi:MAG: MerR family transcriptional regulator [Candidatus Neomarinimicrobiota bacterium]|nr:MerR family transcriptional regulator [Candidatus Neomarinimicrobiota bacterium]RKY48770.1 MAG: MerR family transcriptional regulator [Candidatus Neomarinimicrobiota bacterium]